MLLYSYNKWKSFGGRLMILIFFIATSESMADIGDVRNITDRLVAAEKIERTYVNSLELRGKSGIAAIEKMIAEGFRCRIEISGEHAPGAQAMWYCTKRYSGMASICDELRVALRFGSPAEIYKTHADLLLNLGMIKVESSRASCPAPVPVSNSQVTARSIGEKTLIDAIDALDLRGSGSVAYERLLRDGFYCGFAASDDTRQGPRMECTKMPSKIKFCYEAKVILGMSWLEGLTKLYQAYGNLAGARVTSIEATCEIPVLSSPAEI